MVVTADNITVVFHSVVGVHVNKSTVVPTSIGSYSITLRVFNLLIENVLFIRHIVYFFLLLPRAFVVFECKYSVTVARNVDALLKNNHYN